MTLQEILDELKTKFAVVGEPRNATSDADATIRASLGLRTVQVPVFDVDGKTMQLKVIIIHVLNEGTEKEAAYYMDSEPESRVETKSKVTTETETAITEESDPATETAQTEATTFIQRLKNVFTGN